MTDFSALEQNLKRRGYQVRCFPAAATAADYLEGALKGVRSVAFGGSLTLDQMGLYERIAPPTQVIWHWREEDSAAARRAALTAQVYLTSVNGLSQDGTLILIDGIGNRTAAAMYGHEKIFFVVGRNKLAPTYDEALWRARNIAAPKNAQRLGKKTPCALKADRCYDCKSSDRICRGMTVLWAPMMGMAAEVVLIDEDMGL